MDLERRSTMKPECRVNDKIYEYDICVTSEHNTKMYVGDAEFIGAGTIHSIKGTLQEETRIMYFYRRK